MNSTFTRSRQPWIHFLTLLLTILTASIPARTNPVQIPFLDQPALIDGIIGAEEWAAAGVLELAFETQPGENIPASLRTEVRLYHDRHQLYFAIKAFDPRPDQIRCRLAQRDQIDSDDLVNINLDTFNDERRNYYFGCNPLGVQRDGVETLGGDPSWDGIWDSAGRITSEGYELEVAIPFSTIRFQRTGQEQIWGLDISRWVPRAFRQRLGLVPIERGHNAYQTQFLKIRGFSGILPGKNLEIVPTLTADRDEKRSRPDGSSWELSESRLEPGISLGWGLTPNLTLGTTVNPDFSQVEADARQVDLNEPFAIFFSEKRPFFSEGADFFKSRFNLLYTRTMRDPSWGLKLSGKEGPHTLGLYLVQDEVTNLVFPGSQRSRQTSIDKGNMAAVLRYKIDFGPRYTLGAYITSRQGDSYHNRVVGLDGSLRFSPQHKLDFQCLVSNTAYPDPLTTPYEQPSADFSDWAGLVNYQYLSRSWQGNLSYQRLGQAFRADMGYIPKVGYERLQANLGRNWYNPKAGSWWSLIELEYGYWRENELDKAFLKDEHSVSLSVQGTAQTQVFAELESGRETFLGTVYPITTFFMFMETQPLSNLSLWAEFGAGDGIDYGQNRAGKQLSVSLGLKYNPGIRTQISLDQIYEDMTVNGMDLYTAHITQASLVFHLNARTMVRGIVQYADNHRNPANYPSEITPRTQDILTQFLFSYKINPRTLLFLGYNDQGGGINPHPLKRTERSLFLKMSYALRM